MIRSALALLLLALALPAPPARAAAPRTTLRVTTSAELARAVATARAGETILLADGTYDVASKIAASTRAPADAPIVVRAEHKWRASIRSSGVIAFEVTGSNWEFRDLDIRGVCAADDTCEHAFHVVAARDIRLIGNRLVDFNAALKVNAIGRTMAEGGLVENNVVFDTHPRHTGATVAALNIDAANDWIIRGNVIYDFHKDRGDQVSYGAYVKGGARKPIFERNLILCSRHDEDGGIRVGLSFGGGGTGGQFCSPGWDAKVPCDPEVTGGIMRNNIVANCSDVGIYLNRAKDTSLLFNTLIRTHGIDVRFPSSSATVHGNLLAGRIHARDGGHFTATDNMDRMISGRLEDWYQNPDAGDLRLKSTPTALLGKAGTDLQITTDYCGRPRKTPLDIGALQSSLGSCPTIPGDVGK